MVSLITESRFPMTGQQGHRSRNIHLTTEQFWETQILEQYREQARASNNYVVLENQLRMQADPETMLFVYINYNSLIICISWMAWTY